MEEEEKEDCVFVISKKVKNRKFKANWKENKFKRIGNLEECEIINPKKEEVSNVKKISFDDFKNMMKDKLN